METKEITEALGKGGRKVILVHGNADCDAIGSAYALAQSFPPSDIYAPAGMDRVAKMVSEKLRMRILDSCDLSSYDTVVVVDTSSPEQLQNENVTVPDGSIVIDHHARTGKWDAMRTLIDDSRTSCCEIILDLINEKGAEIDRNTGLALIGGMLTDSGHFQFSDARELRAFAEVMEKCQIPMDVAMQLTRAPVNMSERTAAMKAVGRSRFERVGDMIVAVSVSSSFEAACCRALIASGADVVFVGSQRDDEFRVSGRATQEAVRRGVKLDEIMGSLSHETETDGGGHGGAAGMTGTGDAEAMLHMCMMKTMDVFREIKAKIEAGEIPAKEEDGESS